MEEGGGTGVGGMGERLSQQMSIRVGGGQGTMPYGGKMSLREGGMGRASGLRFHGREERPNSVGMERFTALLRIRAKSG